MKIRLIASGLALSAALTAGVAATASAQAEPSPDPAAKAARTEFVCAHQDEIADLLTQRLSLLDARIALWQDARQAAAEAGADGWVKRIDARITKATAATERVGARQEKLATWVEENCAG